MSTPDALTVDHLDIAYRVRGVERRTLRDVGFRVGRHESYGLVGESGCGKTTTALAIARYLPRDGRITGGRITVAGRDIMSMRREELRQLRAHSLSVVSQEPGRALNPSLRVGRQVAEAFEVLGTSRREALMRAENTLRTVRIADPDRVMRAYPHQLSGGMLQRVVIAMAIAVEPDLLILDEPTTGLDATVEAEVLDLIADLRHRTGTAVLFISHNLAMIAKMCDRVGVMYAGEIVEEGRPGHVFDDPRHPYTVGLLRCLPRSSDRERRRRLYTIPGFMPAPGEIPVGCIYAPRCALADDRCRAETPPAVDLGAGRTSRCFRHGEAGALPWAGSEDRPIRAGSPSGESVIRAQHVSKTYDGTMRSLIDVDLELSPGETLGIVGESGSGKTTLARVLTGLTAADEGSIVEVAGRRAEPTVARRTPEELRLLQLLFQNPDSALNRRHSVRQIIDRALVKLGRLDGAARRHRLAEIIESVRLEARHLPMRPAQLSGGMKQRVAIGRAFAGSPAVLVCDEPTSALDVSVQAAILNLLVDLQTREGVAYLFISHDLEVIRYMSDRIIVLYLGRVMEYGPAPVVIAGPHHPYTEALLSAALTLSEEAPERIHLQGDMPNPADPPSGCVFRTRCHRRLADGTCEAVEPPLVEIQPGRFMRCHLWSGAVERSDSSSGG